LTVLHVEDDEDDAILLAKACERADVPVRLIRVSDAEQGRDYLLRRGRFCDPIACPPPQIIVLDLKLPNMTGFEFLKWLRGEPDLSRLPVLVFTASLSLSDKADAMGQGATSYFVKPASFDALVHLVECFRDPGSSPQAN
jgi:DNA-binding response OmpR family regulator